MIRYTTFERLKIPQLMLGTVGLGMPYGIANKKGQPVKEEALNILSFAVDQGITAFDTASSYGNAEGLIGNFLNQKPDKEILTVTKFKLTQKEISCYESALASAKQSIQQSLLNLGIRRIPICLFHMSRELDVREVAKILPDLFEELKTSQLIDIAGISIDHPNELEHFADNPIFQAFQIPINILDQRLCGGDTLRKMKQSDKILFARSIFLQGLFFLHEEELSPQLKQAAPYLSKLKELSIKENITIQQLAFAYIRDLDAITSIVFGAECIDQIRQNIELLETPAISKETKRRIEQEFAFVPEVIITPGMWNLNDNN